MSLSLFICANKVYTRNNSLLEGNRYSQDFVHLVIFTETYQRVCNFVRNECTAVTRSKLLAMTRAPERVRQMRKAFHSALANSVFGVVAPGCIMQNRMRGEFTKKERMCRYRKYITSIVLHLRIRVSFSQRILQFFLLNIFKII